VLRHESGRGIGKRHQDTPAAYAGGHLDERRQRWTGLGGRNFAEERATVVPGEERRAQRSESMLKTGMPILPRLRVTASPWYRCECRTRTGGMEALSMALRPTTADSTVLALTQPFAAGGSVDVPGESHVADSHSHVCEVDAFALVLAARLAPPQDLADAGVDPVVAEQALGVHEGRRDDTAVFQDFPIVGDDLAALLNHLEFALVPGQLDGQRAGAISRAFISGSLDVVMVRAMPAPSNAAAVDGRRSPVYPTVPALRRQAAGAFGRAVPDCDLVDFSNAVNIPRIWVRPARRADHPIFRVVRAPGDGRPAR